MDGRCSKGLRGANSSFALGKGTARFRGNKFAEHGQIVEANRGIDFNAQHSQSSAARARSQKGMPDTECLTQSKLHLVVGENSLGSGEPGKS